MIRIIRRNWKKWLTITIGLGIGVLIVSPLHRLYFTYYIAPYLPLIAFLVQMLFQLGFSLLFGIVQFVGLMYFLAGAKIIVIRPGDATTLTLDDYRGQPQLIDKAQGWMEMLLGQSVVTKMGGRIPHGIMLIGKPGTGKTYLAKCLAGEAGVPVVMLDASQLVSMWMGVGILKVMRFFSRLHKEARNYGGVVGFVDEIDTVGRRGGGGAFLGGGGGFWGGFAGLGVINRFLVEMDGMQERMTILRRIRAKLLGILGKKLPPPDYHVLVIAATNRPEGLDAALMREGRFDIIQFIEPPNWEGRKDILKYYLKQVKTDKSVDIIALAGATIGFVPSALEALVKISATWHAVKADRPAVSQDDLQWAVLHRMMGEESTIPVRPEERRKTAVHEAGHTIVAYYMTPDYIVRGATCQPHTGGRQWRPTLGQIIPVPEIPEHAPSHKKVMKHIMVFLGSLAAEKLCLRNGACTGVSQDLRNANSLMDLLYKTGYFGLRIKPSSAPAVQDGGDSLKLSPAIEKRMERLFQKLYGLTRRLLIKHRSELDAIAEALYVKGDISGAEIQEIIESARRRD